MAHKISVVLEKDDDGYYAWCPKLNGCQSQGSSFDEALANMREAVEVYLASMSDEERHVALSRDVVTTAIELPE